jgi:hypothetical protein
MQQSVSPCDVCIQLFGDTTPKISEYCTECSAWICEMHRFDMIGRMLASVNRLFIGAFAGNSLGGYIGCSYYYFVQSGDSLDSIARLYGMTVADLQAINDGITTVSPGQRLCLAAGHSDGFKIINYSPLAV